jgi:uncharacterized SAM-binding protein YcdF (DUF218 family)
MDVNEKPIKADYILPLAGNRHRLIKAAQLYNSGYAPIILISNAIKYPPSKLTQLKWEIGYPKYTNEQLNALLLKKLGAQSAILEPFGNGHISTVEEVEALKAHLNGKTPRILVVTSPYHARRAKMIFEEMLPDCTVSITVTDEGAFKKRWWKDQVSAQNLVMEFAKTMHYLMGGVFRSTD